MQNYFANDTDMNVICLQPPTHARGTWSLCHTPPGKHYHQITLYLGKHYYSSDLRRRMNFLSYLRYIYFNGSSSLYRKKFKETVCKNSRPISPYASSRTTSYIQFQRLFFSLFFQCQPIYFAQYNLLTFSLIQCRQKFFLLQLKCTLFSNIAKLLLLPLSNKRDIG